MIFFAQNVQKCFYVPGLRPAASWQSSQRCLRTGCKGPLRGREETGARRNRIGRGDEERGRAPGNGKKGTGVELLGDCTARSHQTVTF